MSLFANKNKSLYFKQDRDEFLGKIVSVFICYLKILLAVLCKFFLFCNNEYIVL